MLPAVSICRSRLRIHETCNRIKSGKVRNSEFEKKQQAEARGQEIKTCCSLGVCQVLKITNSALKSFAQVRLTALCVRTLVSSATLPQLPHLPHLPHFPHSPHSNKAQSLLFCYFLSYFLYFFVFFSG